MKKLIALLLALAFLTGLTACGKSGAGAAVEKFSDLAGKNVVVNSVPISAEQFQATYKNTYNIDFASVKITPTVMESTMIVQNGQADAAITPVAATAEYFARENDDLRAVVSDITSEISIALDAKNTGLLEELNGALATLRENDTIDGLVEKWIDGASSKNLQVAPVEKIEGADTLTIGISGDVLPLDYVAVDGSPAGFNVALMTEIGKLLNKNIEFAVVSTDAKFTSILSGKIDAFFWHISILPLPEDIAVTDSYYTTHIAAMLKK